MPIRPERYDRGPLSDAERLALAVLVNGDAPLNSPARKRAEATLVRLTRPLHEVYARRRVDATTRPLATRVMFLPRCIAVASRSGSGRRRSGAMWWV